jgi:hypothetical protein
MLNTFYSVGHQKSVFTGPKGFDGHHGYEIIEKGNGKTELCQATTILARNA